MNDTVEFNVSMYGNILLIGVYGSIGDILERLDTYKMPVSDKIFTLNMYLTGLDLGVFLGSNNNLSIDIRDLPLVGAIKDKISKHDKKEISAEKTWNDIIFDNIIMSGVV